MLFTDCFPFLLVFGMFTAKSFKNTFSFILSVCVFIRLSIHNNLGIADPIFMKFDIRGF